MTFVWISSKNLASGPDQKPASVGLVIKYCSFMNQKDSLLPRVHKAYERVFPVGKAGLVNVVGVRALPIRTGELKGRHLGQQTTNLRQCE
jgi:hypothetical protein